MDKRYLLCLAMLSVLLFAAAILPTFSVASEAPQGSLEARATHIVVGRVKAIESSWNDGKTFIYSLVTVTAEKVLKGTVKNKQVVIRHLGGEVDGIGQWTEHEPSFKRGEKVKLYLKQEQDGVYTVVGGDKGKESLEAKEVQSPGYYWEGHRWLVLPVKYYINLALSPFTYESTVKQSFQTWEDDPGSKIDYTYMGTTTKVFGRDNYNVVFLGLIDGPGNILATCTFWYVIATKEIVEFDIEFDKDDPWVVWEHAPSPLSFDVGNVGTHEAGHSLGLLDLYGSGDTSETMYGYSSKGQTTKRTLYTGDLKGLNLAYPVTYNLGTTIYTDKTLYRPGWLVQVSPRITAKWIDGKTIDFLWALYVGGSLFPILYAPGVTLPEMCDMVLDVPITIPDLGGATFDAAWVVAMRDTSTNTWYWGYCLWTYSFLPSTEPAMTPAEFAAQIANSTSLPP